MSEKVEGINDFIIQQVNNFLASNLEKINRQELIELLNKSSLSFIDTFESGIDKVDLGPLKPMLIPLSKTITDYLKSKWLQ